MRKPCWILILFACVALCFRPVSARQDNNLAQARQAVQVGVEQMRLGNLLTARTELETAIRLDPNNGGAYLELGLLLGQAGDVEGAAAAFRKALSTNPNWPEAHFNIGLTLVTESNAKRDWPGAMAEFRTALRLKPDYAEAHHLLGAGLLETGDRNAAIAEFTKALKSNPMSPEIHLDLGRALQENGDRSNAERELREALRIRPDYADAEITLAKSLSGKTDRRAEAMELLRRALQSNPDNANAQYALGKALQESGETTEASVAFRQASAITRRQQDTVQSTRLSNEGLDAAHNGDLEEALRKLQQAVDLCPTAAILHYNLGLILASRSDYPAARSQVIEAISLAPLELRFYNTLAKLWKESGDEARSRAASSRAALIDGTHSPVMTDGSAKPSDNYSFEYGAPADTADGHFAFASILARQGDWNDAVGEWLHVLALRPPDLDARNNLGVTYAHLSKDDAAELEFRKALQVNPDSAAAHFGLAMLNLQRGNHQDAQAELREVVRINPDYPNAKTLLQHP